MNISPMGKIVFFSLGAFLILGLVVWMVFSWEDEARKPKPLKSLSSTVAEDVAYYEKGERFPRATCSACRVGKLKVGLFALGGFNTLEIDNLVVNIPANKNINALHVRQSRRDATVENGGEHIGEELVEEFDLKPLLELAKTKKRFSGIRISGLEINRTEDDSLVPILRMDELKNKGRDILLSNVTIYKNGVAEEVGEAQLLLKPTPQIVWRDQAIAIDDLI